MKKFFVVFLITLCFIFSGGREAYSAGRVGLLLTGTPDSGFYDACLDGLDFAGKRFAGKIRTKLYNVYGTGETPEEALWRAAAESDLVIAATPDYVRYLEPVMKRFPCLSIVALDDAGVKGVTAAVFRDEEGGFLAGALAAKITGDISLARVNGSKTVGVIIGEEVQATKRFRRGFFAGARWADKSVRVLEAVAGSFADPKQGRKLAEQMSLSGADVIFAAAGETGIGIIEGASECGYWVIGVDSEQELLYPDDVLASAVKRTDYLIAETVKAYVNGSLTKGAYTVGIAEGCIDISIWTRPAKNNIPQGVRAYIAGLRSDIAVGRVKVPTE